MEQSTEMRYPRLLRLLQILSLMLWAGLAVAATPAKPALPEIDLMVELRQVEAPGAGFSAGTQPGVALMAPQQVRVRNGDKAYLSMEQAIPMHWVQSAVSGRNAAGVSQAVTWMQAGQSLAVQPVWADEKEAVTVHLEVQSAAVGARKSQDLPTQSRNQLVTTVKVFLNEWVTVAATGRVPQRGVFSSDGAGDNRRWIQVRVSAP